MAKTFQDLLNEGQAKVLGIVSIVPMDDWNADTQYQKLNLVRHNGATYLAKGGNKNVEPGVTQDWQNSWMLVYLDGILSPDGTYPNLTAGRVMHALAWGNKNYDGSSAQTITAADLGLADVYKPQGSIAFASLPATPNESNYGYVWNITNDFTTDSRFIEGAGKKYSAGTNVGVIEQDSAYYYDIFGVFVDLSNYATVEALNAEITRAKAAEQANATAASKAQSTANSKYTKPSSGIPKSDLAQSVQDSLDKADQAATDIASIKDGTTVVGKAAADEDGNNIPDTYAKQNGSYPKLGAGHFAKQLKINTPSAYSGYVKIGTVPFSAINTWQCYNCIMLISGIFRGSNPASGTPMPTGEIEIETRKYDNEFFAGDTRVGILYGDINTDDIFYVKESNHDLSIYFKISGAEQVSIECEIISEQTGDTDNPSIFVFDGATQLATAPSGAVYAVNRNYASEAEHLQDIVVNVNTTATGWVKFASIKNSIASGTASIAVDFNVLAITTDNFRGGTEGSGKIEAEVRISNGTTTTAGLSVLGGNINPEYFCIVPISPSTDSPGGADLYVNCKQMYASYKITLLSSGSNYQREFEIELKNETPVTSAPSGAVYAVNRNVAAKGITPATGSNSDDVATTEWVNNALPHLYLHQITVTANRYVGAARFMWFSTSSAAYTLTSLCGLIYSNHSTREGRIIPATGGWGGGSTGYYMTTYFKVTSATTAIVSGITRYISGNNLSYTSGEADVESISDVVTQLF